MKNSRRVVAIALSLVILTGVPATTAFADGGSSACDAARAGNNFTAWFYRTFLC